MLSGHKLTLNFYSSPIDILVGFDRTVYVKWDDYCGLIDSIPEMAPHNIHRSDDVEYVALSYLTIHAKALLKGAPPLLAQLIEKELFDYIVKELAVIRSILPLIELSYTKYDAGVFIFDGEHYMLPRAIDKFTTGQYEIPVDVPRIPAAIKVRIAKERSTLSSLGNEHLFRIEQSVEHTLFTTWLMDLSSLPYILEYNQNRTMIALNPKQRFESPRVVGTSRCVYEGELVKTSNPVSWPTEK